ncbi:hypothetical protein QBC32DRAFT_206835, partial [Pseudoneurospora amorphoporcata]
SNQQRHRGEELMVDERKKDGQRTASNHRAKRPTANRTATAKKAIINCNLLYSLVSGPSWMAWHRTACPHPW